jgi:hypothetical protein
MIAPAEGAIRFRGRVACLAGAGPPEAGVDSPGQEPRRGRSRQESEPFFTASSHQTRTRGPFWSIRPAPILWAAVLGTQIVATLIAVYGVFMTPLGWGWALFVWGYAFAWFLVSNRVKLLAYRIFDPARVQ